MAGCLASFVKEECVVAILLPRSNEYLFVSQLAALKSGAAYTCIDPRFRTNKYATSLRTHKP